MAKVLLLSPPYLDLYGKLNEAAGRYFPLGLGYVASYLRRHGGHEVAMYEPEAQRLSTQDLERIIVSRAPDVVGLTCATPNFMRAIGLARLVKRCSRARVVLGGVHASAVPEFIVESFPDAIDCVVVGEGERTMQELVDAWARGGAIDRIPGIVWRANGATVRTEPRPLVEDLDSLPPPARDLIPQRLFKPNLHNARYPRCLAILTSRGCPFNCSFCAARVVSGRKYRCHSPEYVLEEMAMLVRDYRAQQLLITDDTFTLNRERLEAILEGMIRRRLNLKWFCFSQVTAVDRPLLRLMARAGCYSVGFGVESADPGVLRQMGKPIDPQRAVQAVHDANREGLKTQAFYVFGMPGETLEQMQQTVRFAEQVNSTLAFFNMLVPYPGTRVFGEFFGSTPLGDIEWERFVAIGESCVLRNAAVPGPVIERLLADANRRYYLHPGRLLALLRHIGTLYEFAGYVRGSLSLARQVVTWSK